MLTDNKENVNVEGGGSVKDSIKGKMTEEQDLLRVSPSPCPFSLPQHTHKNITNTGLHWSLLIIPEHAKVTICMILNKIDIMCPEFKTACTN